MTATVTGLPVREHYQVTSLDDNLGEVTTLSFHRRDLAVAWQASENGTSCDCLYHRGWQSQITTVTSPCQDGCEEDRLLGDVWWQKIGLPGSPYTLPGCYYPGCTGHFDVNTAGTSDGTGGTFTGWGYQPGEDPELPVHDCRTLAEEGALLKDAYEALVARVADTSVLRYTTSTSTPTPKAEPTDYCRYWSARMGDDHHHKDRCTEAEYTVCDICHYERESGLPCGLPCV